MQRPHPHLKSIVNNYADCLDKLGRSPENIRRMLANLGRPYGFNIGGACQRSGEEPSVKLRPVLDEIMRDQSRLQQVAEKLRAEDPALFKELVQFIQCQQGNKKG
ncbi:MAG TPA: hypothetical protein P5016_11625 [Verrucomicrobiales bacterium]|nr:hypothetical protein [Verrucomicrobiales bacterium]